VFGRDGLKTGGGGGGTGFTNCACTGWPATAKKIIHPAMNVGSAIRFNLVVSIAVSFEPICRGIRRTPARITPA